MLPTLAAAVAGWPHKCHIAVAIRGRKAVIHYYMAVLPSIDCAVYLRGPTLLLLVAGAVLFAYLFRLLVFRMLFPCSMLSLSVLIFCWRFVLHLITAEAVKTAANVKQPCQTIYQ